MKPSLLRNVEHVVYGKLDNGTPFTLKTSDIAGFIITDASAFVAVGVANANDEEEQTEVAFGDLNVLAIVAQGSHGELSFDEAMELINK